MQDLILVKFFWDCGRMGALEGIFITTKEALEKSYGKKAYFGEVLGKFSEISGTLEEDDFEIVETTQKFIKELEELLGSNISGFNPLEYIQEADVDYNDIDLDDLEDERDE